MKTLFLGVTLGLAAALSFALEEEDITGTWYVKAMVVDKDFPEDRRPRKVSPVKVTALGGGDLEATFTFMREDRCIQKKILMRKTEEPGKFSAYGVRKLIYLQELPGRDHYAFYCKDQHRGGLLHMGKLVASAPCRAVPLSPPGLTWPPRLQVGILIPTWRPWKNLRNWCSARDSQRKTFHAPADGKLCSRTLGPSEGPPQPFHSEASLGLPQVSARPIVPCTSQQPPGLHLQSPPYCQTRSPDHLDLPSSHDPSLLPST
ncbi:odorant-binding protein 2a [Pongo pygmaeus]|uniref:odorant-binding protein 2a n=1 Tax=Pongo pygmaeus TaxID=9600 RepID=UPI00300C6CAB